MDWSAHTGLEVFGRAYQAILEHGATSVAVPETDGTAGPSAENR